ncbi:MAG: DUF1634 domain-containing protein [Bacteroidota bacterium]
MITDTTLEKIVSRTLRYGVLLSAFFMLAGFIAYALTSSSIPLPPDSSPATLWHFINTQPLHVVLMHPYFLFYTGILILLCTPVLRVLVAVASFSLEKDWRFVWISGLVLLIIIVSMIIASTKS